jgi:hypothetical protein
MNKQYLAGWHGTPTTPKKTLESYNYDRIYGITRKR